MGPRWGHRLYLGTELAKIKKNDNHFKYKQAIGLASVASLVHAHSDDKKSVAPLVDQADLVNFITDVEKTMALPNENPFVKMCQ